MEDLHWLQSCSTEPPSPDLHLPVHPVYRYRQDQVRRLRIYGWLPLSATSMPRTDPWQHRHRRDTSAITGIRLPELLPWLLLKAM